MAMHEYAIIGHQRATVGRWIAVASISSAPVLTSFLLGLGKLPWLVWLSGVLGMGVTSGVVYFTLHWVFNTFGWRCLRRKLPDLNGKWAVVGATLNEDRSTRFDWSGELEIVQQWDRLSIALKTATSGSDSESGSILVLPNGDCKLSYSYQNRPRPGPADAATLAGAPQLQKHQGFCELEFDRERKSAFGHYFNAQGRLSFGTMKLTKKAGA